MSFRKFYSLFRFLKKIFVFRILLIFLISVSFLLCPLSVSAQYKYTSVKKYFPNQIEQKGISPDISYSDSTKKKQAGYKYLVRTPPKFTLQVSGGFNLGFAELSSNYADVFDAQQFALGENFGVRYGFGASAIGKFTINDKGNMRFIVTSGYNFFSSELFSKNSAFGKVKYNMVSIGAGIENNFNPKYIFRPYIAFEADLNMISGSASIITDTSTVDVNIKNSFRIGYAVHAGFEYLINNKYGINIGAKLTNANQVLKQSKDEGSSTDIFLRDKRVNPKILLSGFKNFVFVTFYIGVDIFFGIRNQWFKV